MESRIDRRRRRRSAHRPRPAGILAIVLALAACHASEDVDGEAPPIRRVFLLTCDTLRADALGTYGYERETTPRLDAFAEDALVFERAYACAPHTVPALSSLMTGRLPEQVGIAGGNARHMPAQIRTLAERLRDAGIVTAAVVSNGVLERPHESLGDVGLAQGFGHYDDTMPTNELNRRSQFERRAPPTTDAALRWVDSVPRSLPAFLWVHYQDPHGPYTPPAPLAERFESDEPDARRLPLGGDQRGLGQIPAYQALGTERRVGVYRDRYDAEVYFFDRELGRLLDGLAERDLLEDALVVVTADHGESFGEHDYWFVHEAHVYREAVHVPLLVSTPETRRAGGRRVRTTVSHLDVVPTVLDALDVGSDEGAAPVPGRSLLAPLEAPRAAVHTLWERHRRGSWLGVAEGRWHLVQHAGGVALYDVVDDPDEKIDVSAAHPDVVARLLATAERQRALTPTEDVDGVDRVLDADTRATLEQLGYLEGER